MARQNQASENKAQENTPAASEQQPVAATAAAHNTENSLTVGVSGNMQALSSGRTEVDVNKGLTQVKIEYPSDFKGQKFFENGAEPFMSKEVADQLVKAGIAKII
jgi:hypothetical protein